MKSIRAALRELSRPIYRGGEEILISRTLPTPGGPQASEKLQAEAIEPRHAPDLAQIGRRNDDPGASSRILHYLAQGYQGFAAVRDRSVIGYVWFADHALSPERTHPHLARFGVSLLPGEVYLFDLLIDRAFRGQGLASRFLALVQARLGERGCRRIHAVVRASNRPARALYRSLGWVDGPQFRFHCLLGCLMWMDGRYFVRNRPGSAAGFDWREVRPPRPAAEFQAQNGAGAPVAPPSSE